MDVLPATISVRGTTMSTSTPNEQTPDVSTSAPGSEAEAEALFQSLATSIALLPQNGVADGETPTDGSIAIPVIEQDGTQYVPVFTSEAALEAAGADPAPAIQLQMAELAANWPSDDLWLAVNPGSEDGLTLPPEAVQALATFASGPVLVSRHDGHAATRPVAPRHPQRPPDGGGAQAAPGQAGDAPRRHHPHGR